MASKRPKDAGILHGHHVVSGPELRAAMEAARNADETVRVRRRVLHGVVLVLLIGLIAAGIILALAIINGRLKLPAAEVVSGAAGQAAAFTVQRHVPGSDYFQDGRTDASVDVILAQDYKALVPPDLVDQTPGKLSCPRENRRIADTNRLPVTPAA